MRLTLECLCVNIDSFSRDYIIWKSNYNLIFLDRNSHIDSCSRLISELVTPFRMRDSSEKMKLRFWLNLHLYRGIWVSGFGGFQRCSIFSGMCYMTCQLRFWSNLTLYRGIWVLVDFGDVVFSVACVIWHVLRVKLQVDRHTHQVLSHFMTWAVCYDTEQVLW